MALIQPFSLLQQLQVSQTILMLNLRMRNSQTAGFLSMKRYRIIGNMTHSVREGYGRGDSREWGSKDNGWLGICHEDCTKKPVAKDIILENNRS